MTEEDPILWTGKNGEVFRQSDLDRYLAQPAGIVVAWTETAAERCAAGVRLYWRPEEARKIRCYRHGSRWTFELRHLDPPRTLGDTQALMKQVGIERRHGIAHPVTAVKSY